jgi:hypothetical protein
MCVDLNTTCFRRKKGENEKKKSVRTINKLYIKIIKLNQMNDDDDVGKSMRVNLFFNVCLVYYTHSIREFKFKSYPCDTFMWGSLLFFLY